MDIVVAVSSALACIGGADFVDVLLRLLTLIVATLNVGFVAYVWYRSERDRTAERTRSVRRYWFQELVLKKLDAQSSFTKDLDGLIVRCKETLSEAACKNRSNDETRQVVTEHIKSFRRTQERWRREVTDPLHHVHAALAARLSEEINALQDELGGAIESMPVTNKEDALADIVRRWRLKTLKLLFECHSDIER